MSFFRFRWFRRFIRRNTGPISENVAAKWKTKLSVAYMLIAWNAAGIVMYMCFTGKSDWPRYYGLKTDEEVNKRPAIYFAELLGVKKAHVVSFSGLTKRAEFDYSEEKTTELESNSKN